MIEDYEKKRRRQVSSMRSVADYAMGTIFSLIGAFFFYAFFSKRAIMDRDPTILDVFLGAMFLLYGVWRISRGYKKNYFRE